ncbi:MAG: hypothetical protein R6X02_35210 [Enhygromyxa sp.]
MTSQGALMFAVFASRERAREAQAEVSDDGEAEVEVELISTPDEVRQRAGPPGLRDLGMLLGISLIVGFVIAGFGALILTAAGALSEPVPLAVVGGAIAVVVAGTLGGLAGWFAFSSHTRLERRRLCSLVEHGHGLLLFPPRPELGDRLRERGALHIGSLT